MLSYKLMGNTLAFVGVTLLMINVFVPVPMEVGILSCLVMSSVFAWRLLRVDGADSAVEQPAQSYLEQEKAATSITKQDIDGLLQALEPALDFERKILVQELERACTLINNGSSGMSESFYQIKALGDEQQALIATLLSQLTTENEHIAANQQLAQDSSMLKQQMANASASAIRSLQFEDITIQSLQSMSDNVNQLERIIIQLQSMRTSELSLSQQLIELQAVCNEVSHQGTQPSHHRTVAQENMDEGEIELF